MVRGGPAPCVVFSPEECKAVMGTSSVPDLPDGPISVFAFCGWEPLERRGRAGRSWSRSEPRGG
jgi:hypothetical protein